MKHPLIINLYGGPGVGKSTVASGLKYYLTLLGLVVEAPEEIAKNIVWRGNIYLLKEQKLLLEKMKKKFEGIINGNHADIIISDSPFLLHNIYNSYTDKEKIDFERDVKEYNEKLKEHSLNFFLNPTFNNYKEEGRVETKSESEKVHKKIKQILIDYREEFYNIDSDFSTTLNIIELLLKNGCLGSNLINVDKIKEVIELQKK